MNVLCIQVLNLLELAKNGAIWFCSLVLGIFLSAIGYPKEILIFIAALVVIDVLTKHYSIVVINYKVFSFANYYKASFIDKKITSKAMRVGTSVKAVCYLPILYIANQASIIPEIFGGQQISMIFYSWLVIIEIKSILENLHDCGSTFVDPLLRLINKKKKQIESEIDKEDDAPVV